MIQGCLSLAGLWGPISTQRLHLLLQKGPTEPWLSSAQRLDMGKLLLVCKLYSLSHSGSRYYNTQAATHPSIPKLNRKSVLQG